MAPGCSSAPTAFLPEAQIVARVLALIALIPAEVRTRIVGADYRTRFPLAAPDGGDDDEDEEA